MGKLKSRQAKWPASISANEGADIAALPTPPALAGKAQQGQDSPQAGWSRAHPTGREGLTESPKL
jgi:hypothetical protein